MRILYFSSRECWPLTTGARLRDYHLARQLARRGELTYLGMHARGEAPADLPPSCDGFRQVTIVPRERAYTPGKLLRGFIGPDPVTVLNYWSAGVAMALEQVLRSASFDTVQLEGVHLVKYLLVIRQAAPRAAVIADWHNIESEILHRFAATDGNPARRVFARRTAYLVEQAESVLLKECDAHTVASDRERIELQQRSSGAVLDTLPNGVDVDYYAGLRVLQNETRRDVLFVGSMDYHANIDAALWLVREAWPQVRSLRRGLRLFIVGRKPAPSVRALAADDIVVTGTVDDVRPFYARALAVAAPLRVGSGTRLKILEAMAAGVPVVLTRLGAEGLDIHDERDIVLADTAEAFAAEISRLASTPELRERLARAGRDLVVQSYDWAGLGERLYAIHTKAHNIRQASAKVLK